MRGLCTFPDVGNWLLLLNTAVVLDVCTEVYLPKDQHAPQQAIFGVVHVSMSLFDLNGICHP